MKKQRIIRGSAIVAIVLAGIVGAGALAAGQMQDSKPASKAPACCADAPEGEDRDYTIPVPEGKLPVVDNNTQLAGFIDEAAYDSMDRFPRLEVEHRGQPIYGLDVTDESGKLVGYFAEILGFVDLDTLNDPAALDQAYATIEEMTRVTPEQQKAAEERAERNLEEGRKKLEAGG